MNDKNESIFGNKISSKVIKKAEKSKEKFIEKFGDDSEDVYHLKTTNNDSIGKLFGVKNIEIADDKTSVDFSNSIIVGNIRMGYGHYRIAMAIASAAYSKGYTPLWFDLNSFAETTGGKVIKAQNDLYSLGSRLSSQIKPFNDLYWEKLNYEGFKKLSYNASDQEITTLMTTVFKEIPKDVPFIGTHVWPSQAAVHAEMNKVINVIPDNWPMALHLAEGSVHTVQTHYAYYGYRTLNGFQGNSLLNPMKNKDLKYTGHYVDHELVANIEKDCNARIQRSNDKKPIRFLLTIGGAGAQQELFKGIITSLLPLIKQKRVVLYINVGDYQDVWKQLVREIRYLNEAQVHFNNWDETLKFCNEALEKDITGIHAFCDEDIFKAVYVTNLLMRSCDVLVTKPSELSFYPVPKLFIQHVGGHEQWGAIHSAEIGDGTTECLDKGHILQMMKLLINDRSLIKDMCNNIIKNKSIGIYDGAYKVIDLATRKDED